MIFESSKTLHLYVLSLDVESVCMEGQLFTEENLLASGPEQLEPVFEGQFYSQEEKPKW